MTETSFIIVLFVVNTAIAAAFALGVGRCAESWAWPPSWLRMVWAWLGSKGLWLFAVGYLWARGRVRFTDDATALDHWIYLLPFVLYTIWHVGAALYWSTGRAVTIDRLPSEPPIAEPPAPYAGAERRSGRDRRKENRP